MSSIFAFFNSTYSRSPCWLMTSVPLVWFSIRETENKDKLLSEVQEVHCVARDRNTCCFIRLIKAFAIRISMIFTFFKPPLEMRSNQSKDQICPPQQRKVVFNWKTGCGEQLAAVRGSRSEVSVRDQLGLAPPTSYWQQLWDQFQKIFKTWWSCNNL